jgi:hypothetical protein
MQPAVPKRGVLVELGNKVEKRRKRDHSSRSKLFGSEALSADTINCQENEPMDVDVDVCTSLVDLNPSPPLPAYTGGALDPAAGSGSAANADSMAAPVGSQGAGQLDVRALLDSGTAHATGRTGSDVWPGGVFVDNLYSGASDYY